MAAAIKAINSRIRANPVLDYFCSTRTSISILLSTAIELRGILHGLVTAHEQKICLRTSEEEEIREQEMALSPQRLPEP